MSTQYTTTQSPRRTKRWGMYILDIVLPLFLVATTLNAWADGQLYWRYFFAAADLYIAMRLATRLSQKYSVTIFLALAGVQFFVLGVYASIYASGLEDKTVAMTSLLMFFTCVILARTEIHGIRLRKLTAPIDGNRAADFPGIYRITCISNGKQYIGQTSQAITARWAEHRAHLNGRRHHNRWLQADWDIYRPEQFRWEVLEVVTDPVWLLDRERYWQDVDYDAVKRYNPPNLAPRIAKASSRPPMKRRRRTAP